MFHIDQMSWDDGDAALWAKLERRAKLDERSEACEDDPFIGMLPDESNKEEGSPLDFVEKTTGQTDKEIDEQIGFMIRHSHMGDPSFFNRLGDSNDLSHRDDSFAGGSGTRKREASVGVPAGNQQVRLLRRRCPSRNALYAAQSKQRLLKKRKTTMSYQDLQEAVSKGPSMIARYAWTTESNGRKIACLLATIVPQCGKDQSVNSCPSSIMRPWLAHLTVWLDDCGSKGAWWDRIVRYAVIIERVSMLDDAADQKLHYAIRALCVREAMSHTTNKGALAVCQTVVDLCDDLASGKEIDALAFNQARMKANSFWSGATAPAAAAATAGEAAAAADDAVAAAAAAATIDVRLQVADRLSSAILDAMETSILPLKRKKSCRIDPLAVCTREFIRLFLFCKTVGMVLASSKSLANLSFCPESNIY